MRSGIFGNVYLGGDSYSASGIASGGFQNSLMGAEDQFIVKCNSVENRLCATFCGQAFGIDDNENGLIMADSLGNVYLSGITECISGIALGGFQNSIGGSYDTYLVKFSQCH